MTGKPTIRSRRGARRPEPARQPSPLKGRKFPAEPLTVEEVRRLIVASSPRCPTGLRNRALVTTLWRGGLRVSEALSLKPGDINLSTGELRVLRAKGGKSRLIALDPEAQAVLQAWMAKRAALGITGHSPLFCTLAGKPIQTAYVRALLPRLARRAGIARRVHPHSLRHTFASECRREGVDLAVISRALGHERLSTTHAYVEHLNNGEVVEALRARTWATAGKRKGEGDRPKVQTDKSTSERTNKKP